MDRVSHKFAGSMRVITIAFSFVMAFALHLDTLDLLGRLSADPVARQSLLGASQNLQTRAEGLLIPATPALGAPAATPEAIRKLVDDAKSIAAEFDDTPFKLIPEPYPGLDFGNHLWGILVSAVLLSLGAPFWFNVLRVSSTLRPVLATKVEREPEMESATNAQAA
jgi:hypothetical protein